MKTPAEQAVQLAVDVVCKTNNGKIEHQNIQEIVTLILPIMQAVAEKDSEITKLRDRLEWSVKPVPNMQDFRDLEFKCEFAVNKAAQMLRVLMDLSPWLSASIDVDPTPCAEYIAICDRAMAFANEGNVALEAARRKSQVELSER